jgi:hypothetical protein
MSLVNELIKGLLLEEEGKKTIGVFGGGFKPPTKGHFEVLKKALDENPEIDEMLVFVGKKERDGITQEESLKIWEIYGKYLPFKVRYIKSTKPPIQLIYNTAKENPESEVLWIIGAREENEDDFKDIASRTSGITKYPNLELRTIVTKGGVSGTAARNAAKVSKEKLDDFLPEFLSEKEKQDIFVMLSNTVTEINENASYSQHIDIWDKIDQLNTHMINKGMNIEPLPTVELINGDTENAKEFLGKTAYYDPNQKHIVLYTEGRHPKDIVRSYAHEMIHHIQNLEDRLGNITTTNTQEDGELNKIEAEANLKGTMTFRNWTDSLQERKTKDPFGINAYAMELGRLREDETEYQIYCDMDGVIADFERGYEELTGIDLQGEFKPEGEEFWDPISKAGVGFWAGLKWMPDGQQLWDYIKPHKPKLLSAPSREDSSRIGKHVWVKHKIPGTKLILRYASQKQELAEPNAILIDDREKNIEQWEAAGGIGILHTSAADTISQLKKLGL